MVDPYAIDAREGFLDISCPFCGASLEYDLDGLEAYIDGSVEEPPDDCPFCGASYAQRYNRWRRFTIPGYAP